MPDAIHDMKPGGGGESDLVSNGYYAVNAAGHVVLVPPGAPLKASMRLATKADLDKLKPSPVKAQVAPSKSDEK